MNILASSVRSGKVDFNKAFEILSGIGIERVYHQVYPSGTTKHGTSSSEIICNCPLPGNHRNGDKNPSCSLNTEKDTFYCHGCNTGGNVIQLVQQVLGISDAAEAYKSILGDQTPYLTQPHIEFSLPVNLAKNAVKTKGTVKTTYYPYRDNFRAVRVEHYKTLGSYDKINRIKKEFYSEYFADSEWKIYRKEDAAKVDVSQLIYGDTIAKTLLIVEGEKNVNLIQSLGLAACCIHKYSAMEATLRTLQTNLVILLGDNDNPGEKWLEKMGAALLKIGIDYRVLRWKNYGVPVGGDIEEYLATGKTKSDFLSILSDACQQPAGLFPGIKPSTIESNSSSNSAAVSLETIAAGLIYGSDADLSAAIASNNLNPNQKAHLKELLAKFQVISQYNCILDYCIEIPKFRISDILPDCLLSQLLTSFSSSLNSSEPAIVASLLTAVSSCIQAGTELLLQKRSNHSVPPYIYCYLNGEPGSGKSPILKTLIFSPMSKIQAEADKLYMDQKKIYEAEMQVYDSLPKEVKKTTELPIAPARFICYIGDFTQEAIQSIIADNPDKPLFICCDEIASNHLNQGRYSGSSSLSQLLNSLFHGHNPIVARKTDGIKGHGKGFAAILGGIQPDLLQAILNKWGLGSGEFSRYWIVSLTKDKPTKIDTNSDDGVLVDFSDFLAGLYKTVLNYRAAQYRLEPDAYSLWATKFNEYEQKGYECSQLSLKHIYSKSGEMLGRFSLLLHLTHAAMLGEQPTETVKKDIVAKAILLTENYIAEAANSFSEMDSETELFNKLRKMLNQKQSKVNKTSFCNGLSGEKRTLALSRFNYWAEVLISRGLAKEQKEKNGMSLIPIEQPKIEQQQPSPIQQQKILVQQQPAPIQEQEQPKIEQQQPSPIQQQKILVQQQPAPIQEQVQPPAPIQEQSLVQEQPAPAPIQEQERIPLGITDVKIKFYQDIQKYVIDYQKDGNVHTYGYFPSSIEEVLKYLPDFCGATDCLIYSSYGDGEAITESYLQAAIVRDLWINQLCSWFNKNKEKYAIA